MISINLIIGSFIVLVTIIIMLLADSLNINKDKGIKILFILFALTIISLMISYFINSSLLLLAGSVYMFAALAFSLLHSSKLVGNKKTLIFFLLAGLSGFISEILCVKYGLFGEYYYYTGTGLLFNLIPLLLPISWAVIIYICYTITNFFLYGFGGEKPRYKHNFLFLMGFLVLLSAIDGLIAVNMDMIIDPVAVSPLVQQWVWVNGGPYFGIPIGNFILWFLITFVSTFIFRFYESFKPGDGKSSPNMGLYAYAPLFYFLYLIQQAAFALKLNHIEYVLIGAATMMPFIILPLLYYVIQKK
ncbi:carotenoid biosynthesis protein [uncultured Methanobacterium sp.]|uniref:carotenoid biosynthesis protein n=1 Tax=uncultured Methanobacterium sp. TaxID=176306 RepID=UPI002AA7F9FE|nr:carotenoid biosynthesis protein [uncultured Methanobacterium sp.]